MWRSIGSADRRRAQAGGKKTPEVIEAIEILLEHDTAGDPITGLMDPQDACGIAELLRQLDIEISANTVARLLHDMDFSLRVNRKDCHRLQPGPRPTVPSHLVIAYPL